MRRHFRSLLFTAAVVALLVLTISTHAEFSKKVSINGGSAVRLTTALSDAGYTGVASLDELSVCVPSSNVNSMYYGSQSNVNASTGNQLEPGSCQHFLAAARPVDASSYYFYVATTESLEVTLRGR